MSDLVLSMSVKKKHLECQLKILCIIINKCGTFDLNMIGTTFILPNSKLAELPVEPVGNSFMVPTAPHVCHNQAPPMATASFSLNDADWCGHILTG